MIVYSRRYITAIPIPSLLYILDYHCILALIICELSIIIIPEMIIVALEDSIGDHYNYKLIP